MTNVLKYENIQIEEKRVPETRVIIYQEDDRTVPLLEWLDDLPEKVRLKCLARIERLKQEGHALRRPEADFLREKIYELRVGFNGINYRMLYFFHGNVAAVLTHGIVKEDKVPSREIDRAIERMRKFESDPEAHTYRE
ncbi:MAG TPA: type II toxin-antitoxin system RelE/ParE family toxin [Candidatus Methylacidiphilales bacterium]|nr:type II toxin-antitoxin system RelE/ParE family toxin [Candidatus Methylacidiphilales bacterium]